VRKGIIFVYLGEEVKELIMNDFLLKLFFEQVENDYLLKKSEETLENITLGKEKLISWEETKNILKTRHKM